MTILGVVFELKIKSENLPDARKLDCGAATLTGISVRGRWGEICGNVKAEKRIKKYIPPCFRTGRSEDPIGWTRTSRQRKRTSFFVKAREIYSFSPSPRPSPGTFISRPRLPPLICRSPSPPSLSPFSPPPPGAQTAERRSTKASYSSPQHCTLYNPNRLFPSARHSANKRARKAARGHPCTHNLLASTLKNWHGTHAPHKQVNKPLPGNSVQSLN